MRGWGPTLFATSATCACAALAVYCFIRAFWPEAALFERAA